MRAAKQQSGGQMSLDLGPKGGVAVLQENATEHGEVFTRRWVVDLILDLVKFTPDRDLAGMVAVEPSCGAGAFLAPMVDRLITACTAHGRPLTDIAGALHAYDLLEDNAQRARKTVRTSLLEAGLGDEEACAVAAKCVRSGDFLLATDRPFDVDFVIGNPPYIRLEDVPTWRSRQYRDACPTMRGRSDVFVGFIETGLRMLKADGVLGFIVADRWMHNQYGAGLRKLVTSEFAVEAVISMHDVDAFEEKVSAYPAITVIRRAEQGPAVVANASGAFGAPNAEGLRRFAISKKASLNTKAVSAVRMSGWFDSEMSWPSGDPANLSLLADLERRFPSLEDPRTGTRVGIGLATGLDSVFLTTDPELVEPDRLLPMLMTKDTASGAAKWSGTYLVNPWDDNGRLVNLEHFPKLDAYLRTNAHQIRRRHVAVNNPGRWYRTIDRAEPGLREADKLVIPDLKAFIQPVLDRGETYPHHGLYFVSSKTWDLEVLGGLLLSDIAEMFVAMHCVKMRGGCYRFQAQYLRRIRVPQPESIGARLQRDLRRAFNERDRERAAVAARSAYKIEAGASGKIV